MASLSPGVLLRLLQDDKSSSNPPRRPLHATPVVLQITGIVPAVAGPDLCPDKGFHIKVSDSSHSIYVSLPADLNDLILADRLQLGQLIQVRRLEPASPVPVLRDFRLLAGRHPCLHDTVDLICAAPAASSSATRPLPPPEKKKRQLHSRTHSSLGDRISEAGMSSPSFAPSPTNRAAKRRERRGSDALHELQKFTVPCMDEDTYDSDDSRFSRTSSPASRRFSYAASSSFSSPSPCTTKARKSWHPSGRITEWRREPTKPTVQSRSSSVSPSRLAHHAMLMPKDDAPACQRNTEKALKVLGNSGKWKLHDSDKACTETSSTTTTSFCSSDGGVLWTSLPPNLMRHGKEVVRQRDSSLQAAIDALLEASAADKLIDAYSELQSDKDGDPQLMVNRFLNFHQSLAQTRSIAQSLERSTTQLSSCNYNPASARPVGKVAAERKSCATSWIKAALESGLVRFPTQVKLLPETSEAPPSHGGRTRNGLAKGSSSLLLASNTLQHEYNRWFLRYIDKFLDSIQSRTGYSGCELEVAGLLCQLKRVDEWLNSITGKEIRLRDGMLSEEEEAEACERVRRKIYNVLLRHVESAAIALESMSTPDEEQDRELMMLSS
ncbi:hypothetical protein OPV22_018697 [Ensete ventricosum]|uniref:Uncharacterized protein n=1 Tax=Ensete ventricosum TaxID=4639 RepID=A0AAV8QUU3_ENSVE|nr:hypothetical protein OPV22_018697 [Ensete ventricosum]